MSILVETLAPAFGAYLGSLLLASGHALAATNSLNVQALPPTTPKPFADEAFCWVAGVDRSPRGGKYLDIWDCPAFDQLAIMPVGTAGQPFDRIRLVASAYIAGPYSDGNYDITFPVTPEYRPAFTAYSSDNMAE